MLRGFIDWLSGLLTPPSEQKRAARVSVPGIVAHYWDGSAPRAHTLRNVSLTGAYLYTTERWYPGTIVRILLQEKSESADHAETVGKSISIPAQVVRHGTDGVALDFLFSTPDDQKFLAQLIAAARDPALAQQLADVPQPSLKT